MDRNLISKTQSLLNFLKELNQLKPKASYGEGDEILWLGRIAKGRMTLPPAWQNALDTVFASEDPQSNPEIWLEVHKKREPPPPPLPQELKEWVPTGFVQYPQEFRDKEASHLDGILKGRDETGRAEVPPQVRWLWQEYLKKWNTWVEGHKSWEFTQDLYTRVDNMRQKLERAGEEVELVLGLGLLEWQRKGKKIQRHLLVAPAEILLEAQRGILRVGPAASSELQLELDMLELQDQPNLDPQELRPLLEELDIQVWDRDLVGRILRVIANKLSPDAQVEEESWEPGQPREKPVIRYAPALILRKRRSSGYQELLEGLLREVGNGSPLTPPWIRLIEEATDSRESGWTKESLGNPDLLYFPLPFNEEQRKIAEKLKRQPYVLVKGPPGTGKSHTIANLICHLLAHGERLLITAHAPKALSVLRGLLPVGLRELCVTSLGSSHEDQKVLETSLTQILYRKEDWQEEVASRKIGELEERLRRLREEEAQLDRELRRLRQAETEEFLHLPFGYSGPMGRIARQLEEEEEQYRWFPELEEAKPCPLNPEEIALFAQMHPKVTDKHFFCLLGNPISLPDPETLERHLRELQETEKVLATTEAVNPGEGPWLGHLDEQTLLALEEELEVLERRLSKYGRSLGESLTGKVLEDWLNGRLALWRAKAEEAALHLQKALHKLKGLGQVPEVQFLDRIPEDKLLKDAKRRLERIKKGWGLGFLDPVLRETRYLVETVRVDNSSPRDPKRLEQLTHYLEAQRHLMDFQRLLVLEGPSGLKEQAKWAQGIHQELILFLEALENLTLQGLARVTQAADLVQPQARSRLRQRIQLEVAKRRRTRLQHSLEKWTKAVNKLLHKGCAPWVQGLAKALEEGDVDLWEKSLRGLQIERRRLEDYKAILERIRQESPKVADFLEKNRGNPEILAKLPSLGKAWNWRAARIWLRKLSEPGRYAHLTQRRKIVEEEIRETLGELAELEAWRAFFQRLDDWTLRNLKAWQAAMRRVGKGRGRFAGKHRREARRYLSEVLPKIPAWIMPLHRVWETTEPKPGIFDTVIIDEASQAGIEALPILLLAKRVVVVGDDMQNSPEGVGVGEADIDRLAEKHLKDFHFRAEFRPDTSFFDHARRIFGQEITLREHFRCVPEIIRFSNELAYRDTPLIPLRQPPPKRLPPLRASLVQGGYCEGEGPRLVNRPEAEALVDTVLRCLEDPGYQGKTMGVIVLQGRAQAELISSLLMRRVEPKVWEERRLVCGTSAEFQGDERDVIFLSMVVAPNYRFRALTGLPDKRRFNVAMSRAREQVWLFHSVELEDLNPEDLRYRLLAFFHPGANPDGVYEERQRLEKALREEPRELGTQPKPYESWFEVDVALELLRRGYRVIPQYPAGGYRIDLVVEGYSHRLAIECDGEAWHGPERFEEDLKRQRQLERAGWRFVRIRESEFYLDRERALARVEEACAGAGDPSPQALRTTTVTPCPPSWGGASEKVSTLLSLRRRSRMAALRVPVPLPWRRRKVGRPKAWASARACSTSRRASSTVSPRRSTSRTSRLGLGVWEVLGASSLRGLSSAAFRRILTGPTWTKASSPRTSTTRPRPKAGTSTSLPGARPGGGGGGGGLA